MEAKFKLKEPKSKDTTLISMYFFFNGKRFVYSTGFKVKPEHWNFDKNRCFENKEFTDGRKINKILDKLNTTIVDLYLDIFTPSLTVNVLREAFEVKIGAKEVIEPISFIKYFEQHKDWFVGKYGYDSGKKFTTALNHLNKFFKLKKKEYNWNDINKQFAEDFEEYLYSNADVKSNNYITNIFTRIKTVMKVGLEKELHTNTKFITIKHAENEVFKIYLSEVELNKLYECNKLDEGEIEVRDLFLIGCYTGLRFSDVSRLRKEHFINGTIQLITSKTTTPVVIPIHPRVKEIFDKRDGAPPKLFQQPVINRYLKDIGVKAEINDQVIISSIEKRKKVDTYYPKHKLITTHTARRSFVTNLLLNGASTLSIMKMTGHSTDRAFLKYVKMSSEQNANIMKDNPFFTTK